LECVNERDYERQHNSSASTPRFKPNLFTLTYTTLLLHLTKPFLCLFSSTSERLFVTSSYGVDALSSPSTVTVNQNDENEKERIVSQLKSKRKEKERKKNFKKLAKQKRAREKNLR
jgi:hypothetical protein